MDEKNPQIDEKEIKRRFQLWLKPSVLNMAEELYEGDNCASRSEFIEKAIMFYDPSAIMPRCISKKIQL